MHEPAVEMSLAHRHGTVTAHPESEHLVGQLKRRFVFAAQQVEHPLAAEDRDEPIAQLRVVAQIKETLILAEGQRGLYLIDQHRAHERVIYHHLLARLEAASPEAQTLLEPVVLELTPTQAAVVEERLEYLQGLGFDVQRYENFPDSVQAVITRRAFAALNEIPTANYAASQNQQIKVGFAEYTGRNFGFALRLESVAFRNKVEEAIECMKRDGWLVKNYEKWFKQPAPKDPALTTIFPGWGPPGFKGHDPAPHTPKCS